MQFLGLSIVTYHNTEAWEMHITSNDWQPSKNSSLSEARAQQLSWSEACGVT